MSLEFREFDADGKFGLSYRESAIGFGDDIGTGGGECYLRFFTAQERMYFRQMVAAEHRETVLIRDLRWLKESVREVVTKTGRVRRKRLLELVARCAE